MMSDNTRSSESVSGMDTKQIRERYSWPQTLYEGHNKTILALCDELDIARAEVERLRAVVERVRAVVRDRTYPMAAIPCDPERAIRYFAKDMIAALTPASEPAKPAQDPTVCGDCGGSGRVMYRGRRTRTACPVCSERDAVRAEVGEKEKQ